MTLFQFEFLLGLMKNEEYTFEYVGSNSERRLYI